MLSEIIDGKVLDWKYKMLQQNFHYAFYVGDKLVGQVFHMRSGWSAVSQFEHHGLCPLDGFKTRWKASEFLVKLYKQSLSETKQQE